MENQLKENYRERDGHQQTREMEQKQEFPVINEASTG